MFAEATSEVDWYFNGLLAGPACMAHKPDHDFNDATLPVGAACWAVLTERFLTD